jgi:hypothetical protein
MVFWTASSIFFCMVCGSVTVMVSLKPVAADVISVVAFLAWLEGGICVDAGVPNACAVGPVAGRNVCHGSGMVVLFCRNGGSD